MRVYVDNKKSRSFLLTLVFVCFSLMLCSSCGGEEPNIENDDKESMTDEVTDEISDDVIDNEIDEMSDEDIIETENETEEEVDEDVDDQEIVYTELESLDECLDSSCKNLCFLQWDEETGKKINWHIEYTDGLSESYLTFSFERVNLDDEKCYSSSYDPGYLNGANWERIESYDLPIEGNYAGQADHYFFLVDTGELWQGKKKIRHETYMPCLKDGEDWCEKTGAERIELKGCEGEYMSIGSVEFVPLFE